MSEIEAVERLHRSAQARLGLAVALLTRDRWATVQATRPQGTAGQWTQFTAEAIVIARELSAELARAYYQLARAIETGYTLGRPLENKPATLGNLRDLFLARVMKVASIGEDTDASPLHALYTPDIGDGQLAQVDILPEVQAFLDASNESVDSRSINIDPFAWLIIDSGTNTLRKLGNELNDDVIKPLDAEVNRGLKRDGEKKNALRDADAAHQGAGGIGAGKADKMSLWAGREVVNDAGTRDRRVIKFARGLGPNPCYFCTALASRGFDFHSRSSATAAWHPSCHCFPIARWVTDSPLPKANLFYEQKWKTVTEAGTGPEKLVLWRAWMAQQRRAGNLPT